MFRLVIEMTETVTAIDGVPVRLWRGTTPRGLEVDVFVHRISTDDPVAQAELERELLEQPAPAEPPAGWPRTARPMVLSMRQIP